MKNGFRFVPLALVLLVIGAVGWHMTDTHAPLVDVEVAPISLSSQAWDPIPATLDIDPDVLNPKSVGNHVTAYIELPEGFDAAAIDVSTVTLRLQHHDGGDDEQGKDRDEEHEGKGEEHEEEDERAEDEEGVPALLHPTATGDHDGDGIPDRMVKFDRQAVLELVEDEEEGPVTLVVSGLLQNGRPFQGSDTVALLDDPD